MTLQEETTNSYLVIKIKEYPNPSEQAQLTYDFKSTASGHFSNLVLSLNNVETRLVDPDVLQGYFVLVTIFGVDNCLWWFQLLLTSIPNDRIRFINSHSPVNTGHKTLLNTTGESGIKYFYIPFHSWFRFGHNLSFEDNIFSLFYFLICGFLQELRFLFLDCKDLQNFHEQAQ